MTNDFLVYGTARGFVHYFYLKQVSIKSATPIYNWRAQHIQAIDQRPEATEPLSF
jgi:hypothetical protein